MTVADLEKVLATVPSQYDRHKVEVKTSGDFYSNRPSSARFGFACCGMGSCTWSDTPKAYYDPIVYIPSNPGPD